MSDIMVYLDDERETPKGGWERAYTVRECIEKLKDRDVEVVSLDHDLGSGVAPGYDVLLWMEKEVFTNPDYFPPRFCLIHTANPSAKDKMMKARYAIYQEARRKKENQNKPCGECGVSKDRFGWCPACPKG